MPLATFQNVERACRNRSKLRIWIKSQMLGTSTDTTWYNGWIFDLAGRYVDVVERYSNPAKESVEFKLKVHAGFDIGLGYGHNITYYMQYPGA